MFSFIFIFKVQLSIYLLKVKSFSEIFIDFFIKVLIKKSKIQKCKLSKNFDFLNYKYFYSLLFFNLLTFLILIL